MPTFRPASTTAVGRFLAAGRNVAQQACLSVHARPQRTAATMESPMPIKVIAFVTVKPGEEQAFETAASVFT